MAKWVAGIGETLKNDINNTLANQKKDLDVIDVKINDLKNKITFAFYFNGIKEFIFWLSCTCNIGAVIYIIYKLVDWSAIIQ